MLSGFEGLLSVLVKLQAYVSCQLHVSGRQAQWQCLSGLYNIKLRVELQQLWAMSVATRRRTCSFRNWILTLYIKKILKQIRFLDLICVFPVYLFRWGCLNVIFFPNAKFCMTQCVRSLSQMVSCCLGNVLLNLLKCC